MRNTIFILVGLGLLGLTGCKSVPVSKSQNEIGYEGFYDSYGNYRLVRRNNDIWMEKLDGSESRRITNTPAILERKAYFSKDGNYIIYLDGTIAYGEGAYLVKTKEDDSAKVRITEYEAYKIVYEK